MKTLEELQKEEQRLRELLNENLKQQNALNAAAFRDKHGFGLGDKIQWLSMGRSRKGIVSSIVVGGFIEARLLKKDGTESKIKKFAYIYDPDFSNINIIS